MLTNPSPKPTSDKTKPLAASKRISHQANNLDEYEEEDYNAALDWFSNQVSWLTSMVFHAVLLIGLSFVMLNQLTDEKYPLVIASDSVEKEQVELQENPILENVNIPVTDTSHVLLPKIEELTPQLQKSDSEIASLEEPGNSLPSEASEVVLADLLNKFNGNDIGIGNKKGTSGAYDGNGFGIGRIGRREISVGDNRPGTGTDITEGAVEKALKWIANHQLADGSWNFDHTTGACQGRCDHAGTFRSARNAATAMAILPFLGAGYTHNHGKYQKTVAAGLNYLIKHGKINKDSADWRELQGTSYSHGVVVLALCEAYAMSKTPYKKKSLSEMTKKERWEYLRELEIHKKIRFNNLALKKAAQMGLNNIMQTQSSDGGWRYKIGTPGDTSVVGWMVMALKSGAMAKLRVSVTTLKRAVAFLNAVQVKGGYGSEYHYMIGNPRKSQATTSIGLLLRMYTTWPKTHPGLAEGIPKLSAWGPSRGDIYYDYYATQVVHHYGGKDWIKWDEAMRPYLVKTQETTGHAAGSWIFKRGSHGSSQGGRLYNTAMACMILEVYYRYAPIYKADKIFEDDFKKEE